MCVEVSTPSKAHTTLCTLPLKSKCSVSVSTTVCCHTVSMFLPRGQQGKNDLSMTETGFLHNSILNYLFMYFNSCNYNPL